MCEITLHQLSMLKFNLMNDRPLWVGETIRSSAIRRFVIKSMLMINDKCYICQTPMVEREYNSDTNGKNHFYTATVDHKIPKIKGGRNTFDNIFLCCSKCNSDKGGLDYEEFIAVKNGLASRLDHNATHMKVFSDSKKRRVASKNFFNNLNAFYSLWKQHRYVQNNPKDKNAVQAWNKKRSYRYKQIKKELDRLEKISNGHNIESSVNSEIKIAA